MSMLSAQCDELRSMAESVGLAVPQAATLMMEAADTIDSLDVENAKMLKLLWDTYDCICEMYKYMDGGYAYEDAEADPAYGPILKRMRELRAEVDA